MIENLMDTYKRYPISFSKGEGSWLYDSDGRKYLDFAAGIAVNVLGHGHPEIKKVIIENQQVEGETELFLVTLSIYRR